MICLFGTIGLLLQATWLPLLWSKKRYHKIDTTFAQHFQDTPISKETLKNSLGKLLVIHGPRGRLNIDTKTLINNLTFNIDEAKFPKAIHTESYNRDHVDITFKKYAYVVLPYWEQLSQSMGSVLALVVQASSSRRSVVAPMVRNSHFITIGGFPIDYYFDRKYMKDILLSQGHPDMVDAKEFHNECSPDDPNYTTVHFLYDQQKAVGFTKKISKLDDKTYSDMRLEAKRKGWTKCSFIQNITKQSPRSKMFCVDTTVVTDWKIFERDVIESPKCLSIVLWRGVGSSFRARFNESRHRYSSEDLFFALKPSDVVMEEVKKFQRKFLASKYVAVQIRGEHVAIEHGLARLEQCIHLLGYVLKLVKKLFDVDKVFVATDMSRIGSGSWKDSVKRDKITGETLPRLQNLVLSVTKATAFEPTTDDGKAIDRGLVALIEMSLVTQARSLLTVGHGGYHEFITSKFLDFHRNEPPTTWSLVKLCHGKVWV